MVAPQALGMLAAAAVLSLAFPLARYLHVLGRFGERTAVSIAGGAAVAYVFVQLSPELHDAASAFREATSDSRIHGIHLGVYLATMVGFLFFYGVEELVIRSRAEDERHRRREAKETHPLFVIHILAFAGYAWLVCYLMVRSPEQTGVHLALYTTAMAMHFVSVAHALREEHGGRFDRGGAWVLAAAGAAGWGCGVAVGLPESAVNLLLGGVSGGVIANTVLSELPRERQGKFVPFLVGAAAYTVFLVLIGQGRSA